MSDVAIQELHFPRGWEYGVDGLGHEIAMTGLSRVTVMTGPNGGGKTRLLQRIRRAVDAAAKPPAEGGHGSLEDLPQLRLAAGVTASVLRSLTLDGLIPWSKAVREYRAEETQRLLERGERDADALPDLMADGLALLDAVGTNHFLMTHPSSVGGNNARAVSSWYARLTEGLEDAVRARLELEAGQVKLFGRPLSDLRESDGQRKLIQYAIGLASLRPARAAYRFIVFMDEPELHLHPAALIALLDDLMKRMPKAQFFVATHSLPLIAHLGFENTWFATDGQFRPAASAPESAILSLLGGHDNIESLEAALDEPFRRAMSQFAAESLVAPTSAHYREGDPQCGQILAAIQRRKAGQEAKSIRVLDYGAGRARLAAALSIEPAAQNEIDYHALDPDQASRADRVAAIGLLHEADAESRCHDTIDSIEASGLGSSFDVVVLCNVLHELHPRLWRGILQDEIAGRLLSGDGMLLILEDLWIPHGELAYDEGFLLLDPGGIQALFNVLPGEDFDYRFPASARYSERLVAYEIAASALAGMTADTVRATIEYTISSSKAEIAKLRTGTEKYGPRRHAKAVMQLANALLLQDSLTYDTVEPRDTSSVGAKG